MSLWFDSDVSVIGTPRTLRKFLNIRERFLGFDDHDNWFLGIHLGTGSILCAPIGLARISIEHPELLFIETTQCDADYPHFSRIVYKNGKHLRVVDRESCEDHKYHREWFTQVRLGQDEKVEAWLKELTEKSEDTPENSPEQP